MVDINHSHQHQHDFNYDLHGNYINMIYMKLEMNLVYMIYVD